MGMYDSIRDARGVEWQTKALGRNLATFAIGDPVPAPDKDCQIDVVATVDGQVTRALATVRDGVVVEVPAERDRTLPHLVQGTFIVPDGKNDAAQT